MSYVGVILVTWDDKKSESNFQKKNMKKDFNFKGAKHGARLDPQTTKIAVTTRLDPDVLSWLREQAEKKGIPYQTLMNSILKEAMQTPQESEEYIREIVRDELRRKTG